MRDVAHSAASPDQAPYAVAEAVFADAKAYLSSREAQQMSESELERELHRRGQELIRRLLQGHLDQRTPGEAAGPVEGADTMSSARSGACSNAARRRPSGRCRLRARVGRARRWRRDAAQPRERRRRPYGVAIDLIHVAEYVCKAVPVFHRHRRIEGACGTWSATGWSSLVHAGATQVPLFHPCAGPDPPGGPLVGAEAVLKLRVLRSQPRLRCVLGLPRRGSTSGTTPSDTPME